MEDRRIFTGKDFPSLRKPKNNLDETTSDSTQIKNDVTKSPNLDNILSHSKLSADAQEFYPKGFILPSQNPIPPSKSVQNRLARTISNDHLQSTSVNNYCQEDYYPEGYDYNNSTELAHLQDVIVVLTSNPGNFDDSVPALFDHIRLRLSDQNMMEAIIACIVDQATAEPNFGYSGARLCTLLNSYSPHTKPCLMSYFDSSHFQLENSDKARNYTLFLAELYSQYDWDTAFGENLLRMLQELLSFNQPADIKCVCQTLKLTGFSLERYNLEIVNTIFDRLKESLPRLPTSQANILKNVLELRASNWGRSPTVQSPSTPIASIPQPMTDYPPESPFVHRWSDVGPVIYGPDGLELSAEENEFLNDIADEFNSESDRNQLWDEDEWDPDMDEEMILAYKKFVAMNNKK